MLYYWSFFKLLLLFKSLPIHKQPRKNYWLSYKLPNISRHHLLEFICALRTSHKSSKKRMSC